MATVTFGVGNFVTTGGNTSATLTPAVGDLLVVIAESTGLVGGPTAVTDDQGGTYTNVTADVGYGSNNNVINWWVRTALVTSAVPHVVTVAEAASTGGGLAVYRVAGCSNVGAAAVRSTGTSTGAAGTTPAPVLNLTPLSTSVIFTAVCAVQGTVGITPRTGYTEGQEQAFSAPTTDMESAFLNSGETSATLTHAATVAVAWGAAAIEIDPGVTVVTTPAPPAHLPFMGRPTGPSQM